MNADSTAYYRVLRKGDPFRNEHGDLVRVVTVEMETKILGKRVTYSTEVVEPVLGCASTFGGGHFRRGKEDPE